MAILNPGGVDIKHIRSGGAAETLYSPADQGSDGTKPRESKHDQDCAFYRHPTHTDRVMWCTVSRQKVATAAAGGQRYFREITKQEEIGINGMFRFYKSLLGCSTTKIKQWK